jgi:type IV secretion system protein VirB2
MQSKRITLVPRRNALMMRFAVLLTILAAPPAFAQIQQVTTVMDMVHNVLQGASVTIFTIAIIWAGFKLAFQHAKWSEISNIVIGGILVGGATAIASLLVN